MADCPANSAGPIAPVSAVSDRVRVLLPLPLPAALDYRVPEGQTPPEPGSFVRVSLGPRQLIGVTWQGEGDDVPAERLKPIVEVLAAPPLPAELCRFIERVAAYTLSPPGMVLSMAMRSEAALLPPSPRRVCTITEEGLAALDESPPPKRLTPGRRRVLELLREGPAATVAETARTAGVGAAVVRGLSAAGLAAEYLAPAVLPRVEQPDWQAPGLKLSPAQDKAAKRLVERVASGGFHATVLDGVTGSGKTETYFAAIAAALSRDEQVLVLLPEIALSAQWLERFRRRFSASPVEWHSDIGQTQRRDAWRAVAAGRAPVVVGARSALFLPFPTLGLIVVDEEHDQSYKQEDGVCYQARDMAVLRASLAAIPIVLVSATPSLETVVNVSRGRYERVHLPERHGAANLPAVSVVDMRKEMLPSGRFLSPRLVKAMEETLAEREQVLLFLNRRGYAPLTLCRACGHRFECPNCSAWLIEHRFTRRLLCHHCGYSVPVPAFCPECLAAGTLVPCGPGVERLSEEVAERFPEARTALMVSDALPGPRAAADLADAMAAHRYDVMIGTQIVAKGHHFPMLTLVGIVDADLGLGGGDLRAAERTYQLLHQVAGRAGREERPGRVLIQTYMPEQPVMQALAANDRDRFLETEAAQRRAAHLPPFARLAALIVSANDAESVDFAARALARAAPHLPGVTVLGPAPAPLAVLRGRHRRRLLVQAERSVNVQAVLREWLTKVKFGGSVRLQVDIDPYSFL
jgi:primosomal protein N' (replication factor Y)